MPASLESIIELDFANPPIVENVNGKSVKAAAMSIVGQGTYRRHILRLRSPMDSFGIFFQPVCVQQLFRTPGRLLVMSSANRIFRADGGLPVTLLAREMSLSFAP
jgi:hypothetical protein